MRQLPIADRPREKLLYRGERFLSDAELIAIIIRTGSEKRTALHLAQELIRRFGDLRGLANRSAQELSTIKGIGKAKAAQIKAAFEIATRLITRPLTQGIKVSSGEDIYLNYKERFRYAKREFFIAILLDSGNKIIKDVEVSIGSLTQSIVTPREAFTEAIRESAANIIFVHNHPSGSSKPSDEDIAVTKKLKETADIVGIRMLDHIIVSVDSYASFADEGLL
ncbi:MAG: hypothetical protein A2W05_09385 [Candidatus Schekmanbacteria bacterium RBG_16_38_10]|uniref:MPN domain-containing protein n=1 Tax=Candidatus Schekmanbacteria bacterium RBG_16_38_10 TaxID=1817879 RepID=A0A1F7S0N3_9BACT|nr:MAG: hypothetical protein A2W05_09385 [Candidatus Schekmanbacteria bacterium RBG_16_38_10]